MISKLTIWGLKGQGKREYTLGRLNLIVGPNAAGKTTVVDAIRFLYGWPSGFSLEGPVMRDLLEGDRIAVWGTDEDDTIVSRERALVDGAFQRSKLVVRGSSAAEWLKKIGKPPILSGANLIDMSADGVLAELAVIGATDDLLNRVAEISGCYDLAAARISIKAKDLDAKRRLRACKGSATQSLLERPEAEPDAVPKARASLQAARGAYDTRVARIATAQANYDASARKANGLAKDIQAAAADIRGSSADPEALQSYLNEVQAETERLQAERYNVGDQHAEAKARHKILDEGIDRLQDGDARGHACPTCQQPVGERVYDALLDANADAANEAGRLARQLADIRDEIGENHDEFLSTRDDLDSAQAADRARAERDLLSEKWQAAHLEEDRLLAELKAAEEGVGDLRRARDTATEAAGEAAVSRARLNRWLSDRRRMEKAQADADAASEDIETLRSLESEVVGNGWSRLAAYAAPLVAKRLGATAACRDGRIGLLRDCVFWSGAGLSGAERALLVAALDHALDRIHGDRLALRAIETDPLDPAVVEDLRIGLEAAESVGDVDQAFLVGCHLPPDGWDGWTVIDLTPGQNVSQPGQNVSQPGQSVSQMTDVTVTALDMSRYSAATLKAVARSQGVPSSARRSGAAAGASLHDLLAEGNITLPELKDALKDAERA